MVKPTYFIEELQNETKNMYIGSFSSSYGHYETDSEKEDCVKRLKKELIEAIKKNDEHFFRQSYSNLIELIEYGIYAKNIEKKLQELLQYVKDQRKETTDRKMILSDYNQIIKIIHACAFNANNFFYGNYNGKAYHVTTERKNNGISITIACNDERSLKIDYFTVRHSTFHIYIAGIQFSYYNSIGNSLTFNALIGNLKEKTITTDAANILRELITPYDSEGFELPLYKVSRYSMLNSNELDFVANMISDTIDTKDSDTEVTRENKI